MANMSPRELKKIVAEEMISKKSFDSKAYGREYYKNNKEIIIKVMYKKLFFIYIYYYLFFLLFIYGLTRKVDLFVFFFLPFDCSSIILLTLSL